MREIKFRAWDKEKEEMRQVTELDFAYFKTLPKAPQGQISDIWVQGDNTSLIPFNTVLMQYTEIKDKNGKEIYEGDIVKNEFAQGIVKFGNPDFKKGSKTSMFYIEVTHTNYSVFTFVGDIFTEFKSFKVIGNIYENLKLLEVGNE